MAHTEPVVSLIQGGSGAPFCGSEHVSQSLRDEPPIQTGNHNTVQSGRG